MKTQLWVSGSFTRNGSYHRFYTILLKALLLIVYTFFRFNVAIQATLFWVLYVLYIFITVLILPYRLQSSNFILLFFHGAIFADVTLGLLNATNTNNAFTVASTQSLLLAVLNLLCLFGVFTVVVWNFFVRTTPWPALHALRQLYDGPIAADVEVWISTLRRSRLLYVDSYVVPLETFDIHDLEYTVQCLRKCWMQAKAHGSVFELLLREALDTLILTHCRIRPHTIRSFEHWDTAYSEQLPKMKSREHIYRMMAPKKRRIFYKLLALKNLTGNRAIPKFLVSTTAHTDQEVLRFKAQVMDLMDKTDRHLKVFSYDYHLNLRTRL
jgi:hypothetical protein